MLSPLRLALLAGALDAAWAWQAFHAQPTHAASHVPMLSLVLWTFAHLPAFALGSWLLKLSGQLEAEQLSAAARWLLAGLGLLQTCALAWGLGAWWRRRR